MQRRLIPDRAAVSAIVRYYLVQSSLRDNAIPRTLPCGSASPSGSQQAALEHGQDNDRRSHPVSLGFDLYNIDLSADADLYLFKIDSLINSVFNSPVNIVGIDQLRLYAATIGAKGRGGQVDDTICAGQGEEIHSMFWPGVMRFVHKDEIEARLRAGPVFGVPPEGVARSMHSVSGGYCLPQGERSKTSRLRAMSRSFSRCTSKPDPIDRRAHRSPHPQ